MAKSSERAPLRSMTGFGRAEGRAGGWRVGCEVKSVNHRFLDLRVFLPEGLGDLEEGVRRSVQTAAARGRVEVRVNVDRNGEAAPVQVDRALARALVAAVRTLEKIPGVRGGLDAGKLLDFPGLIRVDTAPRSGGPALQASRPVGWYEPSSPPRAEPRPHRLRPVSAAPDASRSLVPVVRRQVQCHHERSGPVAAFGQLHVVDDHELRRGFELIHEVAHVGVRAR